MKRFWRDGAGSVAVEYVLIAGLVSLLVMAGGTAIGARLGGIVTTTAGTLAP